MGLVACLRVVFDSGACGWSEIGPADRPAQKKGGLKKEGVLGYSGTRHHLGQVLKGVLNTGCLNPKALERDAGVLGGQLHTPPCGCNPLSNQTV